jgi:hypothetical protein
MFSSITYFPSLSVLVLAPYILVHFCMNFNLTDPSHFKEAFGYGVRARGCPKGAAGLQRR